MSSWVFLLGMKQIDLFLLSAFIETLLSMSVSLTAKLIRSFHQISSESTEKTWLNFLFCYRQVTKQEIVNSKHLLLCSFLPLSPSVRFLWYNHPDLNDYVSSLHRTLPFSFSFRLPAMLLYLFDIDN